MPIDEKNKLPGCNMYFVGLNETGNFVYARKVGNRETFIIIDLTLRDLYDKCFDDAKKRAENPVIKKQRLELRTKFNSQKLLSADEAIKNISK